MFDFGDGPGINNMDLDWYAQSGYMTFGVQDQNQNWTGIGATTIFPQGQWVHVAFTVDAQGNAVIYANDEATGTGQVSVLPLLSRAHMYLVRSNFATDSAFTGSIDEVKIWSVARTVDQIRADMTSVPTGSEPGLEAYYRFGEDAGTIAYDSSPFHRDATLTTNGGAIPSWDMNSAQGIDLNGDGVTPNGLSPRQGPNNLQNAPVVITMADGTRRGWLGGSLANTRFHLEFFASAGYADGGAGQAEVWLGSLDVTTNGVGQVVFDIPFHRPSESRLSRPPQLIRPAIPPRSRGGVALLPSRRRRSRFMSRPASRPLSRRARGDAIVLQDPEAGPLDPAWDLSLSVAAGTLRLSTTTGLSGMGDGTGTLQYRGGLTELNTALEGLRYATPEGFHGQVILTISAGPEGTGPRETQVALADGIFAVTTTADSGPGSLREAILDANQTGGSTTIVFAIPGTGVQRIALLSPLPAISHAVLIDGFSQPSYAGTPLILIDGSNAGPTDGLTLLGSGATVRGLAIGEFAGSGHLDRGTDRCPQRDRRQRLGIDPNGTSIAADGFGIRITGGAAREHRRRHGSGARQSDRRQCARGGLR